MTTPERLRRRQRRESAFIAVLALMLVVFTVYFIEQGKAQDRCFRAYLSNQAATSQARSAIVERESQATRDVILGTPQVTTPEAFQALIGRYREQLRMIDDAREKNPVEPFDPESC